MLSVTNYLLNNLFYYLTLRGKKTDIMDVPREQLPTIAKRVTIGFFTNVLLYSAQLLTSYRKAMVIFFTNTLMIPLMAKIILNEPLMASHITGIVLGFIGMLFTAVPYKNFRELISAMSSSTPV